MSFGFPPGKIVKTNPIKSDWYFILLALVVVAMIAINELGYGIFAVFLLFPAYWLMGKAFTMQ